MKEVIKLKLESYCEWCVAQGGNCRAKLDGCSIHDVLALLCDKPCQTCGGSGEICTAQHCPFPGEPQQGCSKCRWIGSCPACKPKEPKPDPPCDECNLQKIGDDECEWSIRDKGPCGAFIPKADELVAELRYKCENIKVLAHVQSKSMESEDRLNAKNYTLFADLLLKAADRIEALERDIICVKSLCDSMDEFGEPMKDNQWTELGERIYEIVAEQAQQIAHLQKYAKHKASCNIYRPENNLCDCGFEQKGE